MLYADDLVLTAQSREEVTDKFNVWNARMEKRGLKINMDKTMVLVTGKEAKEKIQAGSWLCGSWGWRVWVNSILCVESDKWCHKRCLGLQRLQGVRNFVCPGCTRRAEREERRG
jgi:hypothetical protein